MARKIPVFKTYVMTAPALPALSKNIHDEQKWDCCRQLNAYLHRTECDLVCLLLGLRRTGKAALLRQAVLDMTPEDATKAAYIDAAKQNTIVDLGRDMEQLCSLTSKSRPFLFLKSMTALDLIMDRPIVTTALDNALRAPFIQPGMRFCQARVRVH